MMTYQLAQEDLRESLRASRTEPKGGFMAMHWNRMAAERFERSGYKSDREYGAALRRECNRAGARMYRQHDRETLKASIENQLAVVKVRRGEAGLLLAVQYANVRLILDMRIMPPALKSLLPAQWPKAQPEEFSVAFEIATDPEVADALLRIGVLEVL